MEAGWLGNMEDKFSSMNVRYENSPKETAGMNTTELRRAFLVEQMMVPGKIEFTYSHYDRVILGGSSPLNNHDLILGNYAELKSEYFLERRELGIINVGGSGEVIVDGEKFILEKLDALYIGKECKEVVFRNKNENMPASYFLMSAPAHKKYPTMKMAREAASPLELGALETSNQRIIYKYIHADGLKSCQLVMGLTVLKPGNVWNTMPAHTHDRRMEVYFYFDMAAEHRVFHLMGQPHESRHMVVGNHQGIISPPWSMHAGCGTSNYSFIWGMAGENQAFTDMDFVAIKDIK